MIILWYKESVFSTYLYNVLRYTVLFTECEIRYIFHVPRKKTNAPFLNLWF